MRLLTCVDEVLTLREVCQACEKAPRAPASGASIVGVFNEVLQVNLFWMILSPWMLWMFLEELLPHTRSRRRSAGCLGRLLQFMDRSFRPSVLRPDGCGWGMGE